MELHNIQISIFIVSIKSDSATDAFSSFLPPKLVARTHNESQFENTFIFTTSSFTSWFFLWFCDSLNDFYFYYKVNFFTIRWCSPMRMFITFILSFITLIWFAIIRNFFRGPATTKNKTWEFGSCFIWISSISKVSESFNSFLGNLFAFLRSSLSEFLDNRMTLHSDRQCYF